MHKRSQLCNDHCRILLKKKTGITFIIGFDKCQWKDSNVRRLIATSKINCRKSYGIAFSFVFTCITFIVFYGQKTRRIERTSYHGGYLRSSTLQILFSCWKWYPVPVLPANWNCEVSLLKCSHHHSQFATVCIPIFQMRQNGMPMFNSYKYSCAPCICKYRLSRVGQSVRDILIMNN